DEPGPLSSGIASERFDREIGDVLSLHGVLQHGLQFFFRLARANLRADSRRKLHSVKRKGDDVVRAQVESASTLQSPASDQNEDFQKPGIWTRFQLRDQAAASQVRGRGLGQQDFGRESQDPVDGQTVFARDFVALAGQGVLYL